MSNKFLFATVALLFSLPSFAGLDEDAIKKLINDYAKIESNFPRTLDIQSILNVYAPDSSRIEDGEVESIDDTKKDLADIEEMINLGNAIGISSRVSNIKVKALPGGHGWAIYDYSIKSGVAGTVIMEDSGICTAIFKKTGAAWFIQHKHCSTPKPDEVEAEAPAPELSNIE